MNRRRGWFSLWTMAFVAVLTLGLVGLPTGLAPVQADEPVVRALYFWAETCPYCHLVMDEFFPLLEDAYGDRLEIATLELSEVPQNYEVWMAAMEAYEVPADRRGIPMLFVGDAVLIGAREIPEQFPGLIEEHLAAGGVGYPEVPGVVAAVEAGPPAEVEPPAEAEAVVEMYFFGDRLCAECPVVEEEVIGPLEERYGAQLVVERRDVGGSSENYSLLRGLERAYGVEAGKMPAIFIGEQVLMGEEETRERLPALVEAYMEAGGVALPEAAAAPEPEPEAEVTGEDGETPIHVAYFHQVGCPECDRVQLHLNYLKHQYPQLVVHTFDVREEAVLAEWLGERAGVPERKRMTAPAVFVGEEALVGDDVHARTLDALIAGHVESGAEPVWEEAAGAEDEIVSGIIARFGSFGLLTVLVAGLVDGLNPCAFATLVFFIAYLTAMGRKGREVLLAGAAFTLAVFLTYLGVGIGVLQFLAALPFLDAVSRWVYGFMAAFCVVLAVGSLYDWWKARRGKTGEMALKMPSGLRKRANRAIRQRAGARAFVPVTFVTGMVVSIIELACTGQVYLPTILFVLGVPEMQAQAGLYLVLYNVMFVVPLMVVFVLAYFGSSSQQLGLFIHQHTAKVKLATAGLFLLLASWMVVTLVTWV